jgi:hypothetical protein
MPGYDPRNYDYSDDEPVEKLRIQTRLHNKVRDGGRQRDAIKMWNWCKEQGWEDRQIITEALVALATAMNEGYEPPVNQQAVLTQQLQDTIMAVAAHVQMLSKLDLSTLRSQPAWNEQTWQNSESLLSPQTANLFGSKKVFEDDDDD